MRVLPLLFAFFLGAARADAESLVMSLSSQRVAITSNYTGAQVTAFGAIDRDSQTVARAADYDVVITVRGPRQAIVVREKEALGPIYINRSQQKFADAPAFLGVYSSKPVTQVTGEALRRRLGVGLDAIVHAPTFTLERGGADDPFRDALLRLKARESLYVEHEKGVTFLTPTIFRATIPLPATAPPGNYDVDVGLFTDGVLLTRRQSRFELVKSGFEQDVAELAHDRSVLYGVTTVAVSLLFGWIASIIFRRD